MKIVTPASDASDQFVAPFRISSTDQALSHDFVPSVDVVCPPLSEDCTWLVEGPFGRVLVLVLSLFNSGGGGGGGGIASEAILATLFDHVISYMNFLNGPSPPP